MIDVMRPNSQPLAGTGSRILGPVAAVVLGAVAAVVLGAASVACGREPTLRGEVDLTIGSADAESEYEFEFPSALTRDADGRIYVGDSLKENVRVYDPDGQYLFHLLRPSRGGGSPYLRPTGLLFDPDGRLWVNDVGSYRRGIDLSLGGVSGTVALGVQGMTWEPEPRVLRLRFSPH